MSKQLIMGFDAVLRANTENLPEGLSPDADILVPLNVTRHLMRYAVIHHAGFHLADEVSREYPSLLVNKPKPVMLTRIIPDPEPRRPGQFAGQLYVLDGVVCLHGFQPNSAAWSAIHTGDEKHLFGGIIRSYATPLEAKDFTPARLRIAAALLEQPKIAEGEIDDLLPVKISGFAGIGNAGAQAARPC